MMFDCPDFVKNQLNGYQYNATPYTALSALALALELIPALFICMILCLCGNAGKTLATFVLIFVLCQNIWCFRKRLLLNYYFGNNIEKLINSAELAEYRIDHVGRKSIVRSIILTFQFNESSIELLIDPNGISNPKKCGDLAQNISLAFNCSAFLKRADYNGFSYELTFPLDYGVSDDEF